MKKFILVVLAASLIIGSCSGCLTKKDENAETGDTAQQSVSLEKCKFKIEDTTELISEFANDHGLRYKNRLCYRSDSHYKIDMTRVSSANDLQQKYEDAIYSIVAAGNTTNAKNINYNIETVLLDDNGYFILYITYEYEYESDW